jgi:thiol-disulfide isomerase/thioredoxin
MDQDQPDDINAESTPAATPAEQIPAYRTTDSPAVEPPLAERRRWIAAAAAALGVALFAVPFIQGPGPQSLVRTDADPGSGQACSENEGPARFDFTLKDMNGDDVRLSDYRGKVILLNFWATWCGPCKLEIPELIEAYDEYRDRGLVILGVLSQDEPSSEDLQAFARGYGMNYPIFRENVELDEAYGPLFGIPMSFIIDRHGSICTKHLGPVSKKMLEREIKGLL